MEINIFISYRTTDVDALNKIVQCLKPLELSYEKQYNVDLKIWYDANEIITGDDVQLQISDNLKKSQIVICIFTPRYFESKWCTFELKESITQMNPPSKKRLVPIVYEEVNWDTDWLGGIRAFPSKESPPVKNWQNQNEIYTMISKEVDENIKIFANPMALDFRNKEILLVNGLLQDKPDLSATVKNLMKLVGEHLPENLKDAIQIHVTYITYEDKEDKVKIQELANIRCEIISKIFEILEKGKKKYAI